MINVGIELTPLFQSTVMKRPFEYDLWPNLHPDNLSYLMPFNESIHKLRFKYQSIFWDLYMKHEHN